jgi:hypothetical protein
MEALAKAHELADTMLKDFERHCIVPEIVIPDRSRRDSKGSIAGHSAARACSRGPWATSAHG